MHSSVMDGFSYLEEFKHKGIVYNNTFPANVLQKIETEIVLPKECVVVATYPK